MRVGSCCTASRTFACASQALSASICTAWLVFESLSSKAPLAAIIVSHLRHRELLTPFLLVISPLYLHLQALNLLLHLRTLFYPPHLSLIFPLHLLLHFQYRLLLLGNSTFLFMLLLHILVNNALLPIYLLLLLFHLLPQRLILLQNLLILFFQQLNLLFKLDFNGFGSFNDIIVQFRALWRLKHHDLEVIFCPFDLLI